jgi:adenylate/nucleoside-diphosphate kinase
MAENDGYINKEKFFMGFKPDQTVMMKKRLLRYLPGLKFVEEEEIVSDLPPDEWYPMVNSYYPFTEDVDAFARVNHLIETKRSLDSLSEKIGDIPIFVINEYAERKAQRQYLRCNPLCFVILGKPGLGEEELGRRLANYWKCVYVDPLTLLEEEIASESRAGQCIEFNLRCGRAIGIDIMTRLLAKKVQTPEVLHRGFVMCGFPLVPNDLYEEDPISSESAIFNVKEIFEDIIDQTIHITDISAKVEVSMAGSSRGVSDVAEKGSVAGEHESVNESEIKMSIDWSIDNQICGPTDISTDLEKQLNCIFGLFHEPFMIVYMYARHSDVVAKRDNYFYDIYSKKNIDMQKVRLFYELGATNEQLTEDLFDEGKNPFAENPNLRHLVQLPENMPAHVSTQLDRYHNTIANLLDYRILLHDIEYYIKLDGRNFISQMMTQLKLRLKILSLQRVLIPKRFTSDVYEDPGEGVERVETEEMTVEEAFLKFSRQGTAGPMYKWIWSDWGSFCPVSMTQGIYQTGSPKYAVHLFNKIYFLADEEACQKFVDNPRPYLLPPFPKPGSKVFLFGPPVCGKSSVAHCLGYLLNSKVLTPDEMHNEYFSQAINEYQDKVKQAAIAEALELLKKRSITEAEEKNEERMKQIGEWEEQSRNLLEKLSAIYEWLEKENVAVISSFPIKMEQDVNLEIRSMDEEGLIRQRLEYLNIPHITSREHCEQLLENREVLHECIPSHLKDEVIPESPSVLDPFVLNYANSKVGEIVVDEIRREVADNMYEMYVRGIRSTEEGGGELDGWIIDGMTTDINLLTQVCEDFTVDDVVILTTSDYNYLSERFKTGEKHVMKFRDFRNFFLSIGEKDAAWRAPSVTSTDSYKKQVVGDILSDILKFDFEEELVEASKEVVDKEYEEKLRLYEEEIAMVESFLDGLGIRPVYVDVKDLSIVELLKEVINSLQDKYRRRAKEFTDEDRAEELQQILAQTVHGTEGEGGGKTDGDLISRFRQYGDTYYYCPVTFADKFVLWRGKEQYAAKFKEKMYFMANEANCKNFLRFPRKYLLQNSPPARFPPPRVCVLGLCHDEKITIAKALAKNLGVRYLNFLQLKKSAVEALSSTSLLFSPEEQELPDALIFGWYDMLFSRLWFEDEYKYIGFVLDDFPGKPADLNYMIFHQAIPDVIICIMSSRENNLKNELEKSLAEWRQKMDRTRKEEAIINSIILQEWEDKRKARYNELMEMKRENRYTRRLSHQEGSEGISPIAEEEAYEPGFMSDTQISFDSVVEQEEHDETMRILDEEFPEPVLEETTEESEEVIIEKFTAEIEKKYDDFVESFDEIKRICEMELIPCVEIDGSQEIEKAKRHAYIVGDEIKFRGPSFFERCYEVSLDVAEKLLESGYYLLSFYGRICPVQYYIGYNPLHMYIASEQKNNLYPVIHRQYIYFLDGKKNRDQFMKNPLKYTVLQNFNFPLIPVRVAVIGPPKSGKTTLANRFRRDLGFKLVSRGETARYTLSNILFTQLNNALGGVLRKGEELSDEMVTDCVQAGSFCGEALSQGLIFDGFPNSITEMNLLSRLGLVPHLIFDLQATDETVFKQAATPNNKYPQYSQRFIRHLLEEWKKTKEEFRVWCDKEYQNIFKLPVDRCIWGVWNQAKEVTLSVMFERKHYYKHVKSDWPLRLANMIVTPLEFLERQSGYKTYCPACLYYSRTLMNGGDPPDRTGLVQYRNFFYWLCEKHIEEFLKNPEMFLPPSNVCLPQELPVVLQLDEPPENAVEDGYCLVCYQKNFPKKTLNKGCTEYAVMYRNKIYLFDTPDCLATFMATPEKLYHLSFNFKEPDVPGTLQYRDLPVLGLLEQYVARTIVRAVNHVNVYRPIIPGLSISQAALICTGLNLKVYNPNASLHDRPKYEQALQTFHQKRTDLIKYLDMMKKYLNPCVWYEEPDTPSSCEEEVDEEASLLRVYSSVI